MESFGGKKIVLGIVIAGIVFGAILLTNTSALNLIKAPNNKEIASPISRTAQGVIWPSGLGNDGNANNTTGNSQNNNITSTNHNKLDKELLNILLVGTDTSGGRRERGQRGFNTDSIILVSINQKTKKVLLTSVPRDLWINDNKINALYIVYGKETLVDAFEKITGMKIDAIVTADFDGFSWVIDAFGGVPINVERSFVDSSFPNNTDSGPITVEFIAGTEIMDGARALTFARSRKGTNGEGSDLMRAKRQHLILQGLVNAVNQPTSKYWPMDIKTFFEAAQSLGDIYTNLTLEDATFLWTFYKDKTLYSIESFVIDGEYIYHPGLYPDSPYHAWVFIPKDETFATLHADIQAKLNGTFKPKLEEPADTSQNTTSQTEPLE